MVPGHLRSASEKNGIPTSTDGSRPDARLEAGAFLESAASDENCRDGVMPLDASSRSKAAAGLSLKASNSGFGSRVQNERSMQSTSCCLNHFGIVKVADAHKYRHPESDPPAVDLKGDKNLRIPFGSCDRFDASCSSRAGADDLRWRDTIPGYLRHRHSALHGVVASRSRSCAAARSLGSMGSISHEPGHVPGRKIAVETRR